MNAMFERQFSRRSFLAALGIAGIVAACSPSSQPAPGESPMYLGKNGVARAILGMTPGTTAMPTPKSIGVGSTEYCSNNPIFISTPSVVPASVYYPAQNTSYSTSLPISIKNVGKPYPILLYAHARRLPPCVLPSGADQGLLDITRDYTLAGYMLAHVASYGCVVVAPDLSWLVNNLGGAFDGRSTVLVSYYHYLQTLNQSVFSNQLDLSRIVLVGHSTGGGACLVARGALRAAGGPAPVALGLIAPATSGSEDVTSLSAQQAPNGLLVLKGTLDHAVGQDPMNTYNQANVPKALVTVPGANHFGYTDVCSADNQTCADSYNQAGSISRLGQQLTGGAYLAALVRKFALGDTTVEPYLSGQRIIEVDTFGVNGVTLQQSGM